MLRGGCQTFPNILDPPGELHFTPATLHVRVYTHTHTRTKVSAASQALLVRRRHFLLHGHHLPSAVSPRPQDTPLGLVTSLFPRLQLSPPLRVRLPPSSPTRSGSQSAPQPDVTGIEFVLRRRAAVTARPQMLRNAPQTTLPRSVVEIPSLPSSKAHLAGLAPPPRPRLLMTCPLPLRAKSRRAIRLHRTGPTSFSD